MVIRLVPTTGPECVCEHESTIWSRCSPWRFSAASRTRFERSRPMPQRSSVTSTAFLPVGVLKGERLGPERVHGAFGGMVPGSVAGHPHGFLGRDIHPRRARLPAGGGRSTHQGEKTGSKKRDALEAHRPGMAFSCEYFPENKALVNPACALAHKPSRRIGDHSGRSLDLQITRLRPHGRLRAEFLGQMDDHSSCRNHARRVISARRLSGCSGWRSPRQGRSGRDDSSAAGRWLCGECVIPWRRASTATSPGPMANPTGSSWIRTSTFESSSHQFDTLLMGRHTFEAAASMGASLWSGMKVVVFSKTLSARDHPGVTIVADGMEETVSDAPLPSRGRTSGSSAAASSSAPWPRPISSTRSSSP